MSDVQMQDPNILASLQEQVAAQPLFDEEFPAQTAGSAAGKVAGTATQAGLQPASPKGSNSPDRLGLLMEVGLELAVELGRTRMTVREVIELQKGSVVELDRIAGEAVDILVNDHLMARGEVVVVDDRFGVRITEIITPGKGKGES
jgi:flagellar motor switch protein FliN/FliY